jgi:hypothetical protein
MGDLPPGSTPQSLDITTDGPARDEHQSSAFRSPTSNSPFHTQLGSIPQGHMRPDIRSPAHLATPHYASQDHGASPLNMGSMAGALPEYPTIDPNQGNPQTHQQSQRALSGASTSALVYQLQQNLQMPAHGAGALTAQSAYAAGQYQQNFAPGHAPHANYGAFHPTQQRLPHPGSLPTQYHQNFHQPSQYMYYPSPYGPQAQLPQGFPTQSAQPQALYGRRPSLSNAPMHFMGQNMELPQSDGVYPSGGRLMPGAVPGESVPSAALLSGSFGAPGKFGRTRDLHTEGI